MIKDVNNVTSSAPHEEREEILKTEITPLYAPNAWNASLKRNIQRKDFPPFRICFLLVSFLFFFSFFYRPPSRPTMEDLSSPIEPSPLAMETQSSNNWTAREPRFLLLLTDINQTDIKLMHYIIYVKLKYVMYSDFILYLPLRKWWWSLTTMTKEVDSVCFGISPLYAEEGFCIENVLFKKKKIRDLGNKLLAVFCMGLFCFNWYMWNAYVDVLRYCGYHFKKVSLFMEAF